ncbi:short-chain dehydrogenase/reductase SDR [Neobacillus bataviensis LMG 21833]|uniref:Short-chain dehydrogenase/reductase SDR n=1 Tax=Neobacillus bataviensis LMG 21833 TaxID=1117379 RepID=K6DF01_9BACI|nr:glucose 1-dehydrogenase [Neobacillus bataviensis]EKN66894.1 short-chain dehydrogenase/reductase SDR [Neobacillus bataviensis LMG 21833]
MGRLENKVAIITGAASGMGEATAKLFASEGAKIVAADINMEALERVVKEIKDKNGEAIAQFVDIGEEEKIKEMIQAAVDTYGRLDILHNNAARLDFKNDLNVKDLDVFEWDETMRYNLRSVMLGTKYAIPVMLENGGGSIINTASMGGQVGELTKSAYAAAKAGVIGLTKSTAVQFGKQGIRCNAIAPGMVLNDFIIENAPEGLKQLIEVYQETKLVNRIGNPRDIANLALFLASEESDFITGQVINADGGILAQNPTVPQVKSKNLNW